MKPHYMKFSADLPPESINEILALLDEDKTRRSLGVMLKDGTYHVIGEIVKFDGCPQDVFDEAMELMAGIYEKK